MCFKIFYMIQNLALGLHNSACGSLSWQVEWQVSVLSDSRLAGQPQALRSQGDHPQEPDAVSASVEPVADRRSPSAGLLKRLGELGNSREDRGVKVQVSMNLGHSVISRTKKQSQSHGHKPLPEVFLGAKKQYRKDLRVRRKLCLSQT